MRLTLFFIFLLFASVSSAQTAVAVQRPGGFQFVNKQTQTPVNDLLWDEAEPFVNGFARVLKHDHFSFVDIYGKPICETQFDAARNFSNQLAAVKKGASWGFINGSGKVVIPFQYEIVFDFKELVTAVSKNKKWFLINSKAEVLKELNISVFYGFNNGIAKIDKDGRAGTMNTKGEIVLSNAINKTPTTLRVPYTRPEANASSACPDNIDFEYGSFFNWKCFIGSVDSVGNTNVITVAPSPPTNNRHTLYSRTMPSPLDAYGLFPTNPPDGSNFAVRLGNTNIGAQAERIQYAIHVPINDSNFSIKYDYAVVFEDPGHTTWTQPRFNAKLFDSAANTYVECASFEYISTSNLPGFYHSTVDTAVMVKSWSSVFVSLRGYAGKTMFLEFTTADCVRRGHWGYAYVDVEKPCGQSVNVQYECTSPNITTLTGPPGFQSYNWWDSTFTVLLGTGQQVVLNPGPPANTTIWLETIPFNDFGCRDSLPVKITGVFNANFTLSDTAAVCAPHSLTFYNSNVPSASATWNFGDGSGAATGDTVTHTYLTAGTFHVTLDVILPSGCVGTVQKDVSILEPVGSFYFDGSYHCNSQQVQFDAVVSDADSLFWDFGDGVILPTVQTTVFHTYTLPGLYLPYLTVQSAFGCHNTLPGPDTIRIEKLRAGFYFTEQRTCGRTVLNFTDTSYSYFGINSYHWDFGDGNYATGTNVSHTYTASGTYNVVLTITGISGCTDVIVKPINVTVNSKPVATITGPDMQCQSTAVVFNSNIISADAINYYQWISTSGSNGSGSTFNILFPQPGDYDIQLIVGTVNGCYDTTTHSIVINPTADMLQPANQLLCEGTTTSDIHFTGTVGSTTFSWTNNDPSIGLAASGTGDIAAFTAINNSAIPVIATITVSPSANSCPGPSKTFTITVNPAADVTQPNDQSICDGSSTTAINFTGSAMNTIYSWTNNNSSIGLAASGNGSIPAFTATNNTQVPITATITVSPNANGCPGPSKTFTITVNPTAAVTQPLDQAVCNATSTADIHFTGAVSTTIYNWVNNDPSIGLAANGAGDIAAFTGINNTALPVTATITVSPTAYGCPGPSKTFNITVNPTPTFAQPVSQVLCKNEPTAAIVFAGSVGTTTFNWANNNTLIGLAANGLGDIPSFTAINNTTQPVTSTITVSANANGCASPAQVFTITVNPSPAVTQPNDIELCNNAATNDIHFATAISGATFNWTNDNPSIGLAASGSGDIASFTALNNTNAPVIATISVTATGNGCPGVPKTFTITVDPSASITQPADQTVCNGSSTNAIGFAGPVSGSSFTWTNDNPSIGLAANGSGDIMSFTAINNTSAAVTATITVNVSANGCPGPSKTFTITVKPTPAVAQFTSQSICNGVTTSTINLSGAVINTTYSWTNNNTSIGLVASGNGDIAPFTALNTGNTAATAIITVIPSSNGCAGPPNAFTITVNPTPNATQPADQLLCNTGTTNAIVFAGTVTGALFTWTNNNPSIGLAATGSGDIASFTAINTTNTVAIASITVVPMANGCPGPGKTFSIVVKPSPYVTQPTSQALCNGFPTAAINFSSTQAGATYSWTNNTPSIGLAASGIGNIPSFNATNNTDTTVTAIIIIRASADGCSGTAQNTSIAVNPTPNVNADNDMNVCRGRTVNLLASGAAQYSWSPAIGLSCTTCPNPSVTPVDSIRYVLKGTSGAGCIDFDSIYLKVIDPFQMRVKPGDTLCIGESTHLKAMDAHTYIWSPATGLDNPNIAEPTATPQTTTLYQVVGYDAYNCFTDTAHVQINVGPRPTVNIGSDINTTTGTVITLHPNTTNGPIITYSWTPATGLSCTDCPTPTTTVTNNTDYTLTVTNSYGCVAKDEMRVTVFCLDGQVFIPNAFTPDGDGLNDILMVRGKGISVKTFRIFNRWGELVFEKKDFNPNDPHFGWDGKVRGVPASPDVFVYTAEVVCDNGVIYTYKGNTTILK